MSKVLLVLVLKRFKTKIKNCETHAAHSTGVGAALSNDAPCDHHIPGSMMHA